MQVIRVKAKYDGSKYMADGTVIPAAKIRTYDRRRLQEHKGKEFEIELLRGVSINDNFSRLRKRRYT